MKAIILAAGLGSRLRHLTLDRPKSMLEIDGRSLIDRQLDIFRGLGIDDITIAFAISDTLGIAPFRPGRAMTAAINAAAVR